jgi:LPXTG-motif cell wall-anchored protein
LPGGRVKRGDIGAPDGRTARRIERRARFGCLLSILTALPLRADVVFSRGPNGAAVLAGLILSLAVIIGGIWWVRRRRKRP